MKFVLILFMIVAARAQDDFVPFFESGKRNNLLPNLIAFYKFEEPEGVAAQDSSGAGRHLTVAGTPDDPSLGGGIVGNAKYYLGGYDGATGAAEDTDYYWRTETRPDTAFSFPGDFTIACWIQGAWGNDNFPLPHFTVASRGRLSVDLSWAIIFDKPTISSIALSFYWSFNGIAHSVKTQTPAVGTTTEWCFLYVKRKSGTLYMSYTPASSATLVSPITGPISTGPFFNPPSGTTQQMRVGDWQDNPIGDFFGAIDEMSFWDRALEECELYWLFSAKNHSFTFGNPVFDAGPCQNP